MKQKCVFPILLSLLLLLAPAVACAADDHLIYEVYASGIDALTAKLDLSQDHKNYDVKLVAATQGLLGRLAPWQGRFEAQGVHAGPGRWQPQIYQSSSVWHKKDEVKKFVYADGVLQSVTVSETGKDKEIRALDKNLVEGTTDSLSATLAIMEKVSGGGACEGSSDVFDGLRRFKLVFHNEGADMLSASNQNVYSGPAMRCTVEVVPVAGRWHAKPRGWLSIQEQGRQKGSLPTVWFAPIGHDGEALPVRVKVVTDYGVMFMQLAQYDKNAQP